jgi:hypothetical protein
MNRLKYINKKIIIITTVLFILGIITCGIPVRGWMPHHLSAFCYLIIIIIWGTTINHRVVDRLVRLRLLIACGFMIFLFVLRMCKYSFFPEMPLVNTYLWYGYYVPLISLPLFMFLAALRVEPVRNLATVRKIELLIISVSIFLILVVLTNELHSQVFKITIHPDKEFTHAWFYYVIVVYMISMGVCTLLFLLYKCQHSAARTRWFIPAIFIMLGYVLSVWYLINGGPPKIGGHKLFQIHEAICMPFIMGFESFIQIGMIPANTGYKSIFHKSGIRANLYDKYGHLEMTSGINDGTISESGDEDHHVMSEPISGGHVSWIEDLTEINKLGREIREATDELSDENDLLMHENEMRTERVMLETRNRLYNKISTAVRTRAARVSDLLEKIPQNGDSDEVNDNIKRACVMTAYIKRIGNLMLLTDDKRAVSSEELRMALEESLDYLQLKGFICDLTSHGSKDIPSSIALLSYELFEEAVEDVWMRLHTLYITLDCREAFKLTIAMDTPAEAISFTWKDKEIKEAGGKLAVRYEDETYYITLSVGKEAL